MDFQLSNNVYNEKNGYLGIDITFNDKYLSIVMSANMRLYEIGSNTVKTNGGKCWINTYIAQLEKLLDNPNKNTIHKISNKELDDLVIDYHQYCNLFEYDGDGYYDVNNYMKIYVEDSNYFLIIDKNIKINISISVIQKLINEFKNILQKIDLFIA